MITLYKKDSKGRIREWNIEITNPNPDEFGISTSDGIHGGKIKDPIYKRAIPNNLFKSSKEKATAMRLSAIDKKLRSNYFRSIEDIKDEDILFMPTGCPSGMIWEEWKHRSHVIYPALASAKLDGSKLYSTWRENRVFLNTRSAKEHKNFKHIEEALATLYRENPLIVLDGEAYNHEYRERFEELQSIFRKESPSDEQREVSAKIAKFYIYDAVDLSQPEMPAKNRQYLLMTLYQKYLKDFDCIVHWPSVMVGSEEEYDEFHEECMNLEFEGSVLKIPHAPYVQKKNKMVMKRKPKFDCEFKILDILEGTGTHKGIAAGVMIDLLEAVGINEGHSAQLEGTHQLSGIAKGWNHDMLKKLLEFSSSHVGKWATIEYGGITTYGKLRFPKFKSIRTD